MSDHNTVLLNLITETAYELAQEIGSMELDDPRRLHFLKELSELTQLRRFLRLEADRNGDRLAWGLCPTHYRAASHKVLTRETSWSNLIAAGKALPKTKRNMAWMLNRKGPAGWSLPGPFSRRSRRQ